MDSEMRQILLETAELTRENNKILRKIQRAGRWSRAFLIFRYVLIAALAFGAYIYLEPYLKNLISAYNGIWDSVQNIQGFVK
ncbi:MAG: hypothetical protein MUD00_03100 [Candidatus Pacebacteria bacterium]|nr:hypothetical protein [Candidatus Paceibacterota bacterium]